VRRNLGQVSLDQGIICGGSPRIIAVVWVKELHLSKAAEPFGAKLAMRFDGPYQIKQKYLRIDGKLDIYFLKDLGKSIFESITSSARYDIPH